MVRCSRSQMPFAFANAVRLRMANLGLAVLDPLNGEVQFVLVMLRLALVL